MLKLFAHGRLHLRQIGPKMFRRSAAGAVDPLEELAKRSTVRHRGALLQQTLQRGCRAHPDIAIGVQDLLLRVCQVNADRQHLGPGVAAALGVLDHLRNLCQLLLRRQLLVLHHLKGLLGQAHESRRPVHDAPHQILIIVFQDAFGDDTEAVGQQRLLGLGPVGPDGHLHGPLGLEGLARVFPKGLGEHQWKLSLSEEVALAVGPEDKDGKELLLLRPVLSAMHRFHQKELMNAQHRVVRHPSFRIAKIGFHVRIHLWK
mmetsp:Transcript_15076/g.25626  ORF Transcript_15076/g.25626 Transcript_15076/m.25626 type:complete len:259 (-) Transcript_15076:467-1243(-)